VVPRHEPTALKLDPLDVHLAELDAPLAAERPLGRRRAYGRTPERLGGDLAGFTPGAQAADSAGRSGADSSDQARRVSATLQAWAGQPAGVKGGSPSKISATLPIP
jgi:hypothetical protein